MNKEEKIIDRVSMIDQWKTSGDIYTQDELNAIGELLDLYYKQQKEIEEIKEDNNHQWKERCKLFFKLENSISKDKIREIIYPTPENPISIDIQSSKMYKRLEELLEEE